MNTLLVFDLIYSPLVTVLQQFILTSSYQHAVVISTCCSPDDLLCCDTAGSPFMNDAVGIINISLTIVESGNEADGCY